MAGITALLNGLMLVSTSQMQQQNYHVLLFFIDKDFFICYTKCDKENKAVNGNALGRGRLSDTAGKEK